MSVPLSQAAAPTEERSARSIPGIEGVWVLIAGDMVIFALLFGSFMHARSVEVAHFEAARHALSLTRGGINTLLLLTSSWCVVMALRSARGELASRAMSFLGGAIVGGAGFVLSKVLEYTQEASAGHTPGSGGFFMYYFMLTGIHLVHVLVGTGILTAFWVRWRRGTPRVSPGFESAAIFWHMVDLLWVVLFPLLYLLR